MPARPPDDPTVLAGRLYDEYGASLYRYALMLLADAAGAEDAVQQVFASLMRGAVTRIEQDAHYLRRAVRNECYSMLRRARRQVHLHGDVTRQSGDLLEPIRGVATTLDERLLLERAIRALSPDQREVIHLHVYEGLTFQEIADTLEESINTVASRYRHALAKLKDILG